MTKTIVKLVIALCTFISFPVHYLAQSQEQQPEAFYVNAVLPENQRAETSSYFDLHVQPNDSQTLQVNVINNTDEQKRFSIQVLDGVTSENGTINYDLPKKYDQTLQYRLSELVFGPKEVVVASRQTEGVNFNLQLPDKVFSGLILGGIKITEVKNETHSGGITNLFSYVIPIKLRESETMVPNKINFKGIQVKDNEDHPTVRAVLQNPQPTITRNVEMTTKIYAGKQQVIAQNTKKELKFAPNTLFSLPIYLGKQPLEPGKYEVEITLKAEGIDEHWRDSFNLTKKQAKKINSQFSVQKKKNSINIYLWILLIIALLIIVACTFIYKNRQANKKTQKKSTKKNTNILLLLLLIGGSALPTQIYASEGNSVKSDVSLSVIRKKEHTEPTNQSQNSEDKLNQNKKPAPLKKALPQTNETDQLSNTTTILGCLVIMSSILLFNQKERRNKK